jgi:hypothetical protein
MGKTIWIDRVALPSKMGFGLVSRRDDIKYDYSVHAVEDGEEIGDDNVVQTFPEQLSGGYGYHSAEELAKRLSKLWEAPVKMAWLEGRIWYRVSMFIPVVAASREEAQDMVYEAMRTNVLCERSRFHTEEGR